MTTSELLAASLAAHKQAQPRGPKQTRPANWLESLKQASDLRKQALSQDPDMTDPAWDAKQHRDYTLFYFDKLGS